MIGFSMGWVQYYRRRNDKEKNIQNIKTDLYTLGGWYFLCSSFLGDMAFFYNGDSAGVNYQKLINKLVLYKWKIWDVNKQRSHHTWNVVQ